MTPRTLARARRLACMALLCALQWSLADALHAEEAEVVSVLGTGEAKETPQSEWQLARLRQHLHGGAFVRTGDLSQMALLLQDQTQLRLNQNSMLQIKEVATGAEPTRLDLKVGRAWMQVKAIGPRGPARAPALVVETPNATAAIRGTDWEMSVDERGAALLTVLSGEVEFFNAFGRVFVGRNEQARVEPGKAPVKILLTNARDRVQWVTAYRAQPSRWLRHHAPELDRTAEAIASGRFAEIMPGLRQRAPNSADDALLLGDVLLAQGDIQGAVAVLEEGRRRFPPDGRFAALLARSYVIADRSAAAAQVLDEGKRTHGDEVEVWIAAGDLARFDGDERAANAAYRRALALQPGNADAWFGLGVVATEREDVRPARRALSEAMRLDPNGPGFLGEWGTLLTFSDEFDAGRHAFDAALAAHPDDYVALTGLGILQLKRGDPEAALQSLLKAGLLEPHYARALLYTGVAYYQLGRRDGAVEMFHRAAELDPRDPLPYLMLSVVASDALAWNDAVVASRGAVERMPYLKSLNQLLNNQKGYAGVGSAIASFGLPEWAQAYAYDAYTPYWAGSHLFLSDRLHGLFNKNSELYQGFLTDPTVFGASNRFSTLIPRPGDFQTFVGTVARQEFEGAQAQAAFNGYHNAVLPLAYYVGLDGIRFLPSGETITGTNGTATVGLGARPAPDVGLFLFGSSTRGNFTFASPELGLPGNPVRLDSDRADAGVNIKFAPDSQAWFKVGSGRARPSLRGDILVDTDGERLAMQIQSFSSFTQADDVQFRHTMDVGPRYELSWGAEWGRQRNPTSFLVTTAPGIGAFEDAHTNLESSLLYVSNRLRFARELQLQADATWHKLRKRHGREDVLVVGGQSAPFDSATDDRDIDELNGSVGAAWRLRPTQVLRLAWQRWRRPASVNTLGPIDTAGIPVDDRLVTAGGRLERLRAQYEWEMTPRTFWQAYADWRQIQNVANPGGSLLPEFQLTDLERLRNLIENNVTNVDFYEDDPAFGAGRVKAAGIALNQILAPNWSMALRYDYHDAHNTTPQSSGNAIPFLPRHAAQVGMTWLPAPRLQFSAVATYRSHRYRDEANTEPLSSGWNGALGVYWETADKRFALGAAAENLLSRETAGLSEKPLVGLQVIWRQ